MARIFITGVTGFAGSHLADSLLRDGHKVFGLVHPSTSHQPVPEHAEFGSIEGDLTNLPGLKAAIQKVEPEIVFHLGGIASPAQSWDKPALTLAINAGGTANILEAAKAVGKPRVIVITSALLYGKLKPEDLPIDENTPPRPIHPYAISKLAAAMLTRLYWKRYDLPAIEVRPFNHIGPHQTLGFVVPDFASQLAHIVTGQRGERSVEVGNLESERDFTDVRDIVRAYRLLAERGVPGETYLVCSGKAVSIRTILETLIEISGAQVEVIEDPSRMQPLETKRIYGSYAKINQDVGWFPRIPLERSLTDAFDEWREKVST